MYKVYDGKTMNLRHKDKTYQITGPISAIPGIFIGVEFGVLYSPIWGSLIFSCLFGIIAGGIGAYLLRGDKTMPPGDRLR